MVAAERQRFTALDRANDIRVRRAALKRQVRAREVRIEDLLREPAWFLQTVPVHELLTWAPRVGRDRVNRWLRRAEVWPLKEVGRLTERQRERVIEQLRSGYSQRRRCTDSDLEEALRG